MNQVEKSIKPLSYSVVIVEYNSDEYLIECIKSVLNQSHKAEKIVVVANGIGDLYKEQLQDNFPVVHLIQPHTNLGYSKAANLGIANTKSDVILTLNPDTVLEQDAALSACTYMKQNTGVGSVGPLILQEDGSVYPSARNEPNIIDAIGHALLGQFKPNNKYTQRYKNIGIDPNHIRQVDWLSGAAIFIRRQAFDDIGGWDERFFMYCEDIDLGRSLRQYRWTNIFLPDSKITHIQGVSTSKTPIPLLIQHHKSLYVYSAKKYENNLIMKILVSIFIAIRLPLALISHYFRINLSR